MSIPNHRCNKKMQQHTHEFAGSTGFNREYEHCHCHRFCNVSEEAIYIPGLDDHYHDIQFRTDFTDGHFHEFKGITTGKIEVGNHKHVHYVRAFTTVVDGHNHEFQCALLIDTPSDFK